MTDYPGERVDITFCGHEMPRHTWLIDIAASAVTDVSEDCDRWFWRFCICAGRSRDATSADVRRYSQELLDALERDPAGAVERIRGRLDVSDPREVYSDWLDALRQMLRSAEHTVECSWSGGEPY